MVACLTSRNGTLGNFHLHSSLNSIRISITICKLLLWQDIVYRKNVGCLISSPLIHCKEINFVSVACSIRINTSSVSSKKFLSEQFVYKLKKIQSWRLSWNFTPLCGNKTWISSPAKWAEKFQIVNIKLFKFVNTKVVRV